MLKQIQQYLSVYQSFVSTSFAESMNFRLHFVLLIVMDLFFYGSAFFTIEIIYNQVTVIGTWNKHQVMFFLAFMLSINQLVMTMTSEAYWRFPELLKSGELDFILLKPVNSLFLTFFRYIRPGSAFNIFFTFPALIYFGVKVDLTPLAWGLLPFFLLFAFLLQSAIDLLIATSMFWMLEGTGMNFLRMEFQQMSRWPDFIYPGLFRNLFSFGVPILLIGSGPIRFLFNPNDFIPFVAMLGACFLLWVLVALFWKKGLRAYESASS